MPALAQVSAELDGRVSFIGIDHQDRREEALALLRQTGVRYPTAFDPTGGTAQDYGLRGMPTTVFIDADGRVLAKSPGEVTESEPRTSIPQRTGRAECRERVVKCVWITVVAVN